MEHRLLTLDIVFSGCAAALPPDAVGLHLVNSFQAQCVVWMLGIKRRAGEIGYEHRIGMHSAARAQIHAHSQR